MTSFNEVIKTRLSHYDEFDDLTSQVYFTMIIYACNTSATIEIEGTEKAFTNIPLNDFPVEKISDFSTHALRNIKVMRGVYDIPPILARLLF